MNIEISFFFSLSTVVYICSVENHQTTKKSFVNYSYTKFVLNFQFEKSLIKYYYYLLLLLLLLLLLFYFLLPIGNKNLTGKVAKLR